MRINSPAYRKAFEQYLRRGDMAFLSLKEEHATSRYVWRTAGDGESRPSHAANEGKIFSWNNPPPTGHPGEEPGCRCYAEDYYPNINEFAGQKITGITQDASPKWDYMDFVRHYFTAAGEGLTLSGTGHLGGLIDYYFCALGKYNDVNAQIIQRARGYKGGFSYYFYNSYSFRPYLYAFGDGVVSGLFSGIAKHENGVVYISGEIEYYSLS